MMIGNCFWCDGKPAFLIKLNAIVISRKEAVSLSPVFVSYNMLGEWILDTIATIPIR
jgi:hypothetical protein